MTIKDRNNGEERKIRAAFNSLFHIFLVLHCYSNIEEAIEMVAKNTMNGWIPRDVIEGRTAKNHSFIQ